MVFVYGCNMTCKSSIKRITSDILVSFMAVLWLVFVFFICILNFLEVTFILFCGESFGEFVI